mmetsp:Transcript_4062/g.11642  ORF Transcript_4062/g.11642 Transcript_4062/m.11642 type:complete len:333 (-) Transcript_4062:134-1132(-)
MEGAAGLQNNGPSHHCLEVLLRNRTRRALLARQLQGHRHYLHQRPGGGGLEVVGSEGHLRVQDQRHCQPRGLPRGGHETTLGTDPRHAIHLVLLFLRRRKGDFCARGPGLRHVLLQLAANQYSALPGGKQPHQDAPDDLWHGIPEIPQDANRRRHIRRLQPARCRQRQAAGPGAQGRKGPAQQHHRRVQIHGFPRRRGSHGRLRAGIVPALCPDQADQDHDRGHHRPRHCASHGQVPAGAGGLRPQGTQRGHGRHLFGALLEQDGGAKPAAAGEQDPRAQERPGPDHRRLSEQRLVAGSPAADTLRCRCRAGWHRGSAGKGLRSGTKGPEWL